MKKLALVILTVSLFFSFTMSALAITQGDSVMKQAFLGASSEKEAVTQGIVSDQAKFKDELIKNKKLFRTNAANTINNPEELTTGQSYKVVHPDKSFVQALLDGQNLTTTLTNLPYTWELPVLATNVNYGKPVASCTVDKVNNNWHVVSIGGYLNPDQIDLSNQPGKITGLLQAKGVQDDFTQFSHISFPSIHMDLLYLDTANGEQFIPLLHGCDELYGLNNQQVYTRQQLVAAIGPVLKDNLSSDPKLVGGGGIINTNNSPWSNINILIAIAGVIIIGVTGIIFFRKRQASHV